MVRAPYFDKNGVKKGAWSQEEDEKLRAYIEKHGNYNWRELPRLAGLSRCGKSCRLRWVNYLRPDIRHGDFSKEEENLILQLHAEIGNKWSTIAARLQGRTDNEIKNYWHSHLKKRAKQYESKLESKGQSSCEASQNETSQNIRDLKAQSIVVPSQPIILESSPLSPESYSLNSEAAQVPESGTKWIAENSPTLVHEEEYSSSADFWTAPFVPDNYVYKQDGYLPSFSLDEGGFASTYASLYDDTIDLFYFYQAMQELPGSSSNSS